MIALPSDTRCCAGIGQEIVYDSRELAGPATRSINGLQECSASMLFSYSLCKSFEFMTAMIGRASLPRDPRADNPSIPQ